MRGWDRQARRRRASNVAATTGRRGLGLRDWFGQDWMARQARPVLERRCATRCGGRDMVWTGRRCWIGMGLVRRNGARQERPGAAVCDWCGMVMTGEAGRAM